MATKAQTGVELVLIELQRATSKFGVFASSHEGYAVLLEEVDELWEAVKTNDKDQQREEAIQVAAMALRFLWDVHGIEPK
jgi:NTP pyrophosphatase (non-canonical NTP hydrolase)